MQQNRTQNTPFVPPSFSPIENADAIFAQEFAYALYFLQCAVIFMPLPTFVLHCIHTLQENVS